MENKEFLKVCIACKSPKPFSEYHKDNARKDKLFPKCKQCKRDYDRAWSKTNNKKNLADKRYRESDLGKATRKRNSKKWCTWSNEKFVECQKRYVSKPEVKASICARAAVRREIQYRQVKLFGSYDVMRHIYAYSAELTATSGERYEVDHIAPLQGKEVSGFHVPWNMRVVTLKQNRSKGNRSIDLDSPSVIEDPGFHKFLEKKGVQIEDIGIN